MRVAGVFELLLARDRSHEVNLITVSIAALVGGLYDGYSIHPTRRTMDSYLLGMRLGND